MTPAFSRLAALAKSVGRAVENTLLLAADDGLQPFRDLAVILRAKLSPETRQGLAWAALMACDDEEAEGIAEAVLGPQECAGPPLPPFVNVRAEAEDWAAWASPEERWAYLGACFDALRSTQQDAFLAGAAKRKKVA